MILLDVRYLMHVPVFIGVRQSTEADSNMISVERIFEMSRLPPEAPMESESCQYIFIYIINMPTHLLNDMLMNS